MKVLIADDDSIIRTLVHRVVSPLAHDVVEAENGLDALGIIERDDPDLLITDLRMPVLDGFELIDSIRNSARHARLPVVCLSSVSERDDIVRLAKLGIVDYVLKPVRPADLAERIRHVVPRAKSWKSERDKPRAAPGAPEVLVVDPDAAFRAIISSALGDRYAIIEATSGAEALNACRARDHRPAIALVSDGLRLLDEHKVARLLRDLAAERGASAPRIILVSDNDPNADPATPFDGVIARATTDDALLSAIAPWLPAGAAHAAV